MERSEVKTEYKWKVEDLFANDEEWEKAYNEVSNALDFSAYRGTLNTPENILAYLKAEEAVEIKLLRVYGYAFLRHDEDVRVTKYNSYFARVMTLITRLGAETSFATPEISALPEATLDALVKNPKLKDYDYMLSRLKAKKKYILSEKEERILAQTQEPMNAANEAFEMLDNADLNLPEIEYEGKKQQLSHGLYSVIMFGSDREKRAEAFKLYYSAYRKLINTLASTYHSNVKQDIFYKNVRGYASCLEMALFNEDVDRSVYDNLVNTVNECAPVMHRYMQVRKKTLGFDEMHVYDMHTPLVENAELRLSYEEAYELVLKGLAPLGKEYNALLKKGRDERWIDVCETEGKRSGAYSFGVIGYHPFVLLNYQKTTNDVFTIAHEMGHSLHTYFSNENQPYAKTDYTIFVAEVASTVNEVL
ncbi:MAG: oligoendopeptidase F family protein, partial [Clostridia bacterium]|nr:oligoendopeptidase F family protein [Clostridia bacterium]